MEKFLKKHYPWVILVIMTFFITVSVLNAKNDSATFDEIAHIPAGYSYVTEQDMRLNPEHPPLLKDMIGLPLIFLNLNFDTTKQFWSGDGLNRIWDDGQWIAGKHLLYEAGNNPNQILFWARIPIIIISVFLGLFIFMWAKEFAGILGGLFALTLYAFDPNILGHNHYVTTDIGIAAFLTFAFYFFLKFIKHPTWKNAMIGGFFLGLVNVVKFSSLMAYPILGLVLLGYPLIKKISHDEVENQNKSVRTKIFFSYLGKGLAAFAISMLVVWIVYFFNTFNMTSWTISKQINFSFPLSDPNILSQTTNSMLTSLNSSSVLRPFAEYMLGVTMVFKRVAGGNGAYYLENVSSDASASYFPLVFMLKETLPFLMLIVFSITFACIKIVHNFKIALENKHVIKNIRHFLQTGVMQYMLFGFIILYSYLSITGNLNIGLRHLFPIMPLLYLLITKKVFDFLRGKHHITKKQIHIILFALLAWIILIPIVNYPNYVSYFNETIGGSKNGYKYVTDSNTDWGQDLGRLKIFLDKNPQIDKIHVDYFGGGRPEQVLREKYIQWWDSMRPIEAGWYAISVNSLQTSIYDKTNKNTSNNYAWTQNYKPVTIIGNSILIYYIPTSHSN
ncbi:MAG: Tetratricopeptide repeat protein [Candidatus Moranbacteria bacterium GW2011_GWE1_36_7]|nr:MAG: Tetratricopeptide repeat protein [Candidatus Moranbacteria bacterium GW2011_GWD2_36_12]KKQ07033.1 MAG: Tetratricopeptide repeat protein [Candidatus Moranbacteria bacterium GW2011_GWE2_36_40]KKQ15389.1 MAG: Tetratricopeptide repeat protein [Candidatus Moranbacteria bacterium GW2011_GWE1_36_7]